MLLLLLLLVVVSACVCTFDYLFRFVLTLFNRAGTLDRFAFSLAYALALYCDFFVHARSTRAHLHTHTHTRSCSSYHQLFFALNTTANHARSVKISTGQHTRVCFAAVEKGNSHHQTRNVLFRAKHFGFSKPQNTTVSLFSSLLFCVPL